MINLKLTFGKDEKETEFEIIENEWLLEAIKRSTKEVPLGEFKLEDVFNVVVNGHLIEHFFWDKIGLKKGDTVLITPKIKEGDFGQVFSQVLLIAIAVAASVVFPPATFGALGSGLLVAAVTIGASLALHALIPPPGGDLGNNLDGIGGGGVETSQMYTITGQSNQMKRLGIAPKVYGVHRIFPVLAANPYTELGVDPATGEVVQYLSGIYDFGLGTPQISDIKIGDTALTTQEFDDFSYRLVDPNRPSVPRDIFDFSLNKTFELYKGDRSTSQLAIALTDGNENIQTSDNNPDSLQQEISLDFVCPRGLFGFDSNGTAQVRKVNLEIDFAPVGSTDWKPYNDPTAVDKFEIIGGTDTIAFTTEIGALKPDDAAFATYFEGRSYSLGRFNSEENYVTYVQLKGNTVLVPASHAWQVGQAIFLNTYYYGGAITAINSVAGHPELKALSVSGSIAGFQIYAWNGAQAYQSITIVYSPSVTSPSFIKSYISTPSKANVVGSRTSAVYASFRFTPKAIGQFNVRVRRTGSEGDYTNAKADDISWVGLTTAYNRPVILTDKRHVFMELRVKATNQLNGNINNLSAVASQVLEVYDDGTETWSRQVTSNPAWVLVDLLTGEVNKKAVDFSRLHLPSIVEWANYCAEVPTPPPSQTFLFPRFQCNFILDYETTLQGVIQQVGGASQASLSVIDGKYGVLVDRLKNTPVQVFTPRNSKDFSSTRLYSTRPDAVKVKYIDPNLGWEVSEVIVYDNGFTALNAENFEELTSFACTSHEQAWRFGRYMIAQNRLRQETMSILVDFESLVCTRGDYVQISQDVMEVGGRPARVKAISGSQFTIDDHLDIDPLLDYGVTHRGADGTITTSDVTVIAANIFTLVGNKVKFLGQDTTGQVLDCYYRHGGIPPVIGSMRKVKAAAGVFSAGDTTYTLPEAPLNNQEIVGWLNGVLRTDYTLVGNVVRFVGQDTTSQDFDTQYRHSGADVTGSLRKLTTLAGVFAAGDTTYTLPEAPISDDDTTGWLDGFMRTDYTVVGNVIRFAGQDTTSQEFDIQYRYSGGTSVIGSGRNANAVVGTFNGTDTIYTLPETPLSNDDLVVCLNGEERDDYTQGLTVPAVGDLVVIGEIGRIVFDCIVKSISPNDDLSAQITLVERANEIFDYESSDVLPDYDPQLSNTARPDFSPPKAVTNLTLTANTHECAQTQSGYNYYAEISWDIPPGSVYEFFEIWMDDGRGYRSIEITNAKLFRVNIDQARLGTQHGLKVVAVAASGKKLQLVQMPEVTFTPVVKAEAPSDVDGFGMSITNQTLQLTWNAISDCDVSKYELRYSPDTNDVWEATTALQVVDRNVNSITVQARTGAYLIKAIDFAGNKSANATRTVTTIPNLFDLNVIESINDAPTFPGEYEQTELLGEAVILTTQTAGNVDTMQFTPVGHYVISQVLDLGDIYSVRLASYIKADGYRFGELMSSWVHLSEVDHLSTSDSDDWNAIAEYRATDEILAMSDWAHLTDIEHINEGGGAGFTDWRPIPTIGDATGRVFQFRVKLESLTPNVTPRLFDATVKADMPDRIDSFENLSSTASGFLQVTYEKRFNGPAPSPNVQISIDNGQTGDYVEYANKSLEGFQIKIYDKTNTQVIRQFDVQAKGYGSRHTVTI